MAQRPGGARGGRKGAGLRCSFSELRSSDFPPSSAVRRSAASVRARVRGVGWKCHCLWPPILQVQRGCAWSSTGSAPPRGATTRSPSWTVSTGSSLCAQVCGGGAGRPCAAAGGRLHGAAVTPVTLGTARCLAAARGFSCLLLGPTGCAPHRRWAGLRVTGVGAVHVGDTGLLGGPASPRQWETVREMRERARCVRGQVGVLQSVGRGWCFD